MTYERKIDAAGVSASFLFIFPNANGKQIAVMTVCSKAAVAKGLKANEWYAISLMYEKHSVNSSHVL